MSVEETARELELAANKYKWCAAQCESYVDQDWDTVIRHTDD